MRVRTAYLISILLSATLGLASCGFAPLHAASTSAPLSAMNLSFDVSSTQGEADDKIEFLMRQAITDRMATGRAVYNLEIEPELTRTSVGVTSDDIASRYDLSLSVKFTLTDPSTNIAIHQDTIYVASTFGAPRDSYGFSSAQNSASERLVTEASDRLILKISTYLKNKPAQNASTAVGVKASPSISANET